MQKSDIVKTLLEYYGGVPAPIETANYVADKLIDKELESAIEALNKAVEVFKSLQK